MLKIQIGRFLASAEQFFSTHVTHRLILFYHVEEKSQNPGLRSRFVLPWTQTRDISTYRYRFLKV